jgi:hypothetical protein
MHGSFAGRKGEDMFSVDELKPEVNFEKMIGLIVLERHVHVFELFHVANDAAEYPETCVQGSVRSRGHAFDEVIWPRQLNVF